MTRALLLMLSLPLAAAQADARKPPPCAPPGPHLYISPMGEPFRAAAGEAYPSARWIIAADADGDGSIGRAEMIVDADRFFTTLDGDRDGEIAPDEVVRYEREIAPEIRLYAAREPGEKVRRKRKSEPYGAPLGAGRWSQLNLPQPVTAADADMNRGVSLAEFRTAASERFARLAKGVDGLTAGTLGPTPAEQRATQCQPAKPSR